MPEDRSDPTVSDPAAGVVTQEHVADSVASSVQVYPG
jgi:hypothetical protein